jgi:AraC-like DNA-binding protein
MVGVFNFWSIVLMLSIGQALILILLLIIRFSQNPLSTRLLSMIILSIMIVNIDYFLMNSSIYRKLPHLIGISIGMMFVFGPLFHLYFRSVIDSAFKWKHIYMLHFLPWVLYLIYNIQFYQLNGNIKILIINRYLQGKTSANDPHFYLVASLQVIHLLAYLLISYKFLYSPTKEGKHKIPLNIRVKWLKKLFIMNLAFILTFSSWFIIVLTQSTFIPQIDFTSTLICSAIVFLIAFKLVMDPDVLTPGFEKKYKSSPLSQSDFEKSVCKLVTLMTKDKLYTELDLKLYEVADQVGIAPHLLSQVVNQQFGKSFIEFINEYRIQEFKKILAEPENKNVSILSLAMKAGFNSKSAFNNAFKKSTGQKPTEYRKTIMRNQ